MKKKASTTPDILSPLVQGSTTQGYLKFKGITFSMFWCRQHFRLYTHSNSHLLRPPPTLPPEDQYHELSPYATVLLDSRPAARPSIPAPNQESTRQTAWHQDPNRRSDARHQDLSGRHPPPVQHCQHHLVGHQTFNQVATLDDK